MTPLEIRLRRIVVLVAVLGVAAGIVGMFPGKHEDLHTYVDYSAPVGGVPLWLFVGPTLLYCAFLHASPRPGVALCWVFWTGIALVTAYGIAWDQHPLSGSDTSWAGPAMHVLVGAMIALIGPVTWFVALASRRTPPSDAVSATVVKR